MNSYPQGYGNPETIKVKPRGPLYSYDVGCRVSSLGARSFEKGLFPYRFAQLSRSSRRKAIPRVNLTVGALTIQNIPHSLNVSDVIRATLVEKVTEPISCFGETFQYTHCGTYNWWMSLPLLLMFVVVLLTSLARSGCDTLSERVTTREFVWKWGRNCTRKNKKIRAPQIYGRIL